VSQRIGRASAAYTEGVRSSAVAVHSISLFGAIVLVLVAILLLWVIGPFGLLILILAGVLLYYAFGPGARNNRLT
jgi:hypothetical protein